jgi:ribosomal-protein-serine acetyltransferase
MSIRVSIRPYEKGDAQALLEAVRESIPEVSIWMPWCHPDYSLEDARTFLEAAAIGWEQGAQFDFAILADDRIAGSCGINRVNLQDRVANLGYWVRSTCTGQGVASVATRKLLAWAFEHTDLNRIEIVAAVGNLASQRVAEKVGARRDAVLAKRTMVLGRPSDAVLFSVLRAD